MIRVRVDDFPNTKDNEKDRHSLAAFREFDRCLRECIGGKRYLLGVIPRRCSVEDVLFLRNETDCEIGMHGVEHDEAKLDIFQNEFAPYLGRQQVGRLLLETSDALQQAVGRRVEIYMPPRNRIDRRTIDLLPECGFYAYTTGPETAVEFRTGQSEMAFYLHSDPPHEYGRTDELFTRGSHKVLCQSAQNGMDRILTLHWTWETNIGLDHMRKFFAEIPKEYFKDFGDA